MWEWLEGKKTVIFNLLTFAALLIVSLTPQLEKDNQVWLLRLFAYGTIIINTILRVFFTNTGVEKKII